MTIASVQQLTKVYGKPGTDVRVEALRGVDIEFLEGESVAIRGQSGSGKSTLMNLLGCLDRPSSGRYILGQIDVSKLTDDQLSEIRGQRVGFVFQSFNLLPRTSALENVETPLIYAGVGKNERHERARQALERMGLGDRLQHLPNQLSGGQQQRVAIARALVSRPSLLLADEPTGNVDTATSAEILSVLETLNRDDGLTIILITHELDVARHAGRTLYVRDGRLEAHP